MKKYKVFYIQYDRYVCFNVEDKVKIRRLYKINENTFYFRLNNNEVFINSSDVYY